MDAHFAGRAPCSDLLAGRQTEGPHQNYAVLEEDAIDLSALSEVLRRHHLKEAWQAFCSRTGIADPCHIQREP